MLAEAVTGSFNPDDRAYDWDREMWAVGIEWFKRHASIALLEMVHGWEPPMTQVEAHEIWERLYLDFKDRTFAVIKGIDAGMADDPVQQYSVILLLARMKDFSTKGYNFLRIKERESLGMAERPEETEVILGTGGD